MSSILKTWLGHRNRFSVPLLLLSLLALLSAYSIYSIGLSVKPFGAATVNLAGRQRMLSQTIAKEILILVQLPSLDGRIRLREHTRGIVALFRRVQQGLEQGDASLGLSGENTAAGRKVLRRMEPDVARLVESAAAIEALSPRDLLRLDHDAPAVWGVLEASEALIAGYDSFLDDYIAGAEREIRRHKALEIAVFAASLLLILLVQFRARGLVRQVQRLGNRLNVRRRLLVLEKLARRRVEEEHRLLIAAVEQANESFVITNSNGIIQYVNPAFVLNTGYRREEILGQNPRILKSGKQDAAFYQRLWNTIASGEPWRGQMVNRNKDGTLRTEAEAIFPIRDWKGRIRHFAAIKHDITRELEMEKRLLEAQKLEAMGVLAGGIAHDFNNILTPIIGFTDLVLDLLPVGSESYGNLAIVRAAASRAKDLVAQIRTAVRQNKASDDSTEFQAVQIQALANEVLTLVRATASKSIVIAAEIPGDLPAVRGDAGRIHRLLMNLCVNACQAMPEGGRLGVALGAVTLHETAGYLCNPAPGDFVRIEVRDTGHGMSEETKAHLFEPYFTTRGGSVGTGLGLFLVFNIVKRLGGGIRVESRERAGTAFDMLLPVVSAGPERAVAAGDVDAPGHERILFVDDEEMIARFAKAALERLGYRVTTMADPTAACALFEADPSRFDVVCTDRSMPGMTGEEVIKRIKGVRPSIPVILCTGLSAEQAAAGAVGFDVCLQKPFASGELSAAIRKVLGSHGASAVSAVESTLLC
jgi:PAS domain S-box-containing protein